MTIGYLRGDASDSSMRVQLDRLAPFQIQAFFIDYAAGQYEQMWNMLDSAGEGDTILMADFISLAPTRTLSHAVASAFAKRKITVIFVSAPVLL